MAEHPATLGKRRNEHSSKPCHGASTRNVKARSIPSFKYSFILYATLSGSNTFAISMLCPLYLASGLIKGIPLHFHLTNWMGIETSISYTSRLYFGLTTDPQGDNKKLTFQERLGGQVGANPSFSANTRYSFRTRTRMGASQRMGVHDLPTVAIT